MKYKNAVYISFRIGIFYFLLMIAINIKKSTAFTKTSMEESNFQSTKTEFYCWGIYAPNQLVGLVPKNVIFIIFHSTRAQYCLLGHDDGRGRFFPLELIGQCHVTQPVEEIEQKEGSGEHDSRKFVDFRNAVHGSGRQPSSRSLPLLTKGVVSCWHNQSKKVLTLVFLFLGKHVIESTKYS